MDVGSQEAAVTFSNQCGPCRAPSGVAAARVGGGQGEPADVDPPVGVALGVGPGEVPEVEELVVPVSEQLGALRGWDGRRTGSGATASRTP